MDTRWCAFRAKRRRHATRSGVTDELISTSIGLRVAEDL